MTLTHRFTKTTDELVQAIDTLSRTTLHGTFCASSDWLLTWCDHYLSSTEKLFSPLFFENDRLVGVAPCYLRQTSLLSGWRLHFIGQGEPERDEVCSEYQDLICIDGYAEKCIQHFESVLKTSRHITEINLNVLTEDAAFASLLLQHTNEWDITIQSAGKSYPIDVKENDKEQITSTRHASIRRQMRKWLESEGDWHLSHYDSQGKIDEGFELLSALHNAAWEKRGKSGAFSSETFCAFHKDFMQLCVRKNKLVLFSVADSSGLLAVFYGVVHGNTLFYYQSGIDRAVSGPGNGVLMHMMALRVARERNLAFYDLMRGDEGSYKCQFTSSGQALVNVRALRGRSRLLTNLKVLLKKAAFSGP